LAEFTIGRNNHNQNKNPFEIQNLNQANNLNKDENISDSEENKKHFFNDSSVNRKNTTTISEFQHTNNITNKEENWDNTQIQFPYPSFNAEAAEKSRDSLNFEIHSSRDSVGSYKSRQSSLAKHTINKSPDATAKLKINNDPPYLPSKSLMRSPRPYTLVLDLDETLVHFVEENDSAYIQIRPGAEHFLEEMNKYYEIVVFTAAMQDVF